MAKGPSARSVRSKQNAVLRYIVSTDVSTASKDLGVSPDTIRRFVSANPQTIKNAPSKYNRLLEANPTQTAKNSDVKLVQRLTGKRLSKAYNRYGEDERLTKAIRLAQVTRERRRIVEKGKVRYVPIKSTEKGKIARKQILANMAGESSKSIVEQYNSGVLTEAEAKEQLKKLWKNSGVKGSDKYFSDRAE